MIYARPPTVDERAELQQMVRHEVGRVSQRASLVLASTRYQNVPELAALFCLSRATVRMWIHRFNARGPIGLYDEKRCGRPHKNDGQLSNASKGKNLESVRSSTNFQRYRNSHGR